MQLIRSGPVKVFLKEHPDIEYVDQRVFFACYSKIKPWLNHSVLVGYLMKYGLVQSSDDMELLTSSFYKPQDRETSLIRMAENVVDGFMLLYMCLFESGEEHMGHVDAVSELNHCGKEQK